MADASPGVGVGDLDELRDGMRSVADDVGGHPLGDCLHPTADDETPVVPSDHEGLDENAASLGLAARDLEGLLDLARGVEIQAYPSSVVPVERLDHDRVANPLRGVDGASRG